MALNERRHPFAGDGGGHPDAELLAEYADQVLAADMRADVERHVARCAECRAVLVDTMAFLAENARPRWQPRLIAATAGLAAAAALVIGIIQPQWLGLETDPPGLRQLTIAMANEPTRPLEGRLAGDFSYAPAPALIRGLRGAADLTVSPDVRIAAATIEKAAQERDTPDRVAVLGVAFAATGDLDRAVVSLERAVAREPGNARFQNNLSAVYMARAQYILALTAAERALAADPRLREACFNRALAFERLADGEARQAWERCLAAETDPAWSAEIRDHINTLKR
ncbi:MAG TPA: zf-HC2 domain-containing protein [Gemmatimonadales bacterium]|nr:zf-HC2 domain-containing protein [Gemmatimonadales bacterium]